MEEGVSIAVKVMGVGSLSVVSGLIGAWIKARYGRTEVTPQPLEVRDSTNRSLEAHIKDNSLSHSNMFSRIAINEQRIAALEAYQKSQGEQLNKIEHKLDRVLEKLK